MIKTDIVRETFTLSHCDSDTPATIYRTAAEAGADAKEHMRWHKRVGWGYGYGTRIRSSTRGFIGEVRA